MCIRDSYNNEGNKQDSFPIFGLLKKEHSYKRRASRADSRPDRVGDPHGQGLKGEIQKGKAEGKPDEKGRERAQRFCSGHSVHADDPDDFKKSRADYKDPCHLAHPLCFWKISRFGSRPVGNEFQSDYACQQKHDEKHFQKAERFPEYKGIDVYKRQ